MNAELIGGLKQVQGGIEAIIKALESGAEFPVNQPIVEEKAEEKKADSKVTKFPKKEEAPKEEKTVTGTVAKSDLDSMSFNDLKKFAKELGVSAVGNRDQITARILETPVEAPVKEEPVAEAPKGKTVSKTVKKTEAPKEEEKEEETTDDGDDEESEIRQQVLDAVEDMSNEEIASLLADVGISAKGKREALIDKVVKAVLDGVIDLDGDEEESEEETTTQAPTQSEESEEEEEDLTNDFNNPDMTEERKQAIIEQDKEIRASIKKKETTRKDMVEFLQGFYETEEDMKDVSMDDLTDTYIDAVCRLINDEGEVIEEGAYEVNSVPFCCGRPLQYIEDTSKYVCELCGEEYDAE